MINKYVGLIVTVEIPCSRLTEAEEFEKEFGSDPVKLLNWFLERDTIHAIADKIDDLVPLKVIHYFHD